jgi:hypothetical protein
MNRHPRAARTPLAALLLASWVLLAGCGAEVAGGAAAVGGLQTQQLQQVRQQQAQVVDGLKAAQAAGMARAASAAD